MTKKEIVRHKENPFIDELSIVTRRKAVKISKLGKDKNVLINDDTGEVNGTYVSTYKTVDEEKFLKLFTANIALTFDLKSAGIKAFNVLCFLLQEKAIEKDRVMIDKYTLEDFNEAHDKKLSKAVLYRGISELIENKIVARCEREAEYFINPAFVFNGDRIVFTTVIEKEEKAKKPKPELTKDDA